MGVGQGIGGMRSGGLVTKSGDKWWARGDCTANFPVGGQPMRNSDKQYECEIPPFDQPNWSVHSEDNVE